MFLGPETKRYLLQVDTNVRDIFSYTDFQYIIRIKILNKYALINQYIFHYQTSGC